MNTKKQRLEGTEPPIYPIKENIKGMVKCAWQLAKVSLWMGQQLPRREEIKAQGTIKSFISNQADPYKGYLEMCQRILLVHKELTQSRDHVIKESSSRYFNPYNESGFVLSVNLFAELQQRRLIEPLHNIELKAFCEAILDMAEDPDEEIFCYWLNWFGERDAVIEPDLFYSSCRKTNSIHH